MNSKSNVFSRGLPRRLFAMVLAVCMVFTMTPPVTAAGVTDSGKILLSGFAELPENIRRQSVPLGVSLGELNLPDTMTATVGAASVDAEPTPDTEPEEPKDSGAATLPTEDAPTLGTSDEPASKGEIIEENDVPLAASPSDAQDKTDPDAGAGKIVIISGITWESDPLYDSETEGTYIFTAVLPSGYTMEDGVAMPEITVVVGQAEQSAVDKVIAMIDALPTMDEWTAMDDAAARAVMDEILAAKKAYDALTAEEKAQIDETRTAKLLELAEMAQQLAGIMPMTSGDRLIFKSDTADISGTGYAWVKDTKTLTLNGYNSASGGAVGIQVPDGATLVVNGTNSLTVTGAADDSNTNNSDYQNYGILCGLFENGKETTLGALTIEGNGTLAVTCAYTGAETLSYSWGMRAKSITMNGGTVTCTADKATESYGVLVDDAITINGGSLTGIGGEATESSYGVSTKILKDDGNLTGSSITVNDGTLTGTGGTGVTACDITVDGGSVVGVGKGDASQNMGVVANNDLTINSGTITGTAKDCTAMSVGVGAANALAVNGGTITATSGTSAMSIAVMAAVDLTPGEGVVIKCNVSGNTGYADEATFVPGSDGAPGMVYEGADQTTIATDVKIYKASPTLDFATEGSTTPATGTGYVWVEGTKTLTLTDFNYTATDDVGIILPDGATLVLNGASSVTAGDSSSVSNPSYGIGCQGAFTVSGTGSLVATAGISRMSAGVMANTGIVVSSGSLTGIGNKGDASIGVMAMSGDITVNGGQLTGIGATDTTSFGVYAPSGTIAVNSGTLIATGTLMGAAATTDLTLGDKVVAKCNSGGSTGYTSSANIAVDSGMDVDIYTVFEGTDQTTVATDVKIYKALQPGLLDNPLTQEKVDLAFGTGKATLAGSTITLNSSVTLNHTVIFDGVTATLDTKTFTITGKEGARGSSGGIGSTAITINPSAVVTITGDMGGKIIGGSGGEGMLSGGNGGSGVTGDVTLSGSVSINGGNGNNVTGGGGYGSGGNGVQGNVTISGSAAINGGWGESPLRYTKAVDGTITVGTAGIVIKGGDNNSSINNIIQSGGTSDYPHIKVFVAYNITKTATTQGSFTVTVGANEVTSAAAGETVTITLTPDSGYAVDTVTVTQGSTPVTLSGTGNTHTFTMPTGDVTIAATFKSLGYPVTINVKKDGVSWSSGKTSKLSSDGGNTFITDLTKVPDGIYTVYEGDINTTVEVTVNGAAASATVNYWGVLFFDGSRPISTPPQIVLQKVGRVTKPSSDPSKTGYTFAGWKTTNGGTTAFDFENKVIAGMTMVYASWTANTYTVTLNGNGGTGAELSTYTYGVGAALPTDWTNGSYTFKGWYDNAGLTGTAVTAISATDTGNKTYWAKWEVISVSGVSLNKTSATLVTGETETLTATVLPADAANKSVTWQSSNTGVATVANGTVTAVDAGTTTITVTTVDGSKTATCAVTVNKNDAQLVAAAKTAAENATYTATTQTATGTESTANTYVKNIATTAVNNSGVTVTVNKVSYTAPTAGTSADPDGTDGSYVFTVTVSKGAQSQTTTSQTLTITATPYTGVSDTDAVAAAKAVVVDGTVNVAFGADQAAKTAAVQSYVDGLLSATPNASGVTATVTHTSGDSYSVAFNKGSVNDSKSITMTVNESADPDLATVTAAKTAAENATYTATTQTATGNDTAANTYVKNIATTAVNNSGVTVTVNKVSYTAPVTGTSADPDGTDGSYVFTVTVSKGAQSQTTVQKTLTITATAYSGVTDADAVAAAKTKIVDGAVDVAFGATQADKTAAVQAYVNSKLTGDAAGVTATVTYNSGTGKYDVALSKGSVTDSKSITMTVNVAPDPDIATVAAAKTAAENATYTATTQAATGTESAAQAYVQNIATTAVNNSGVTVTVNKVSYIAPVAGTSSDKDGTNGSYVFTITVSKGSQSQTTTQKTLTITATPYTGVTDAEAVAAAKDAVVDGTVTVPTGANQADKTAAVQSYVNDKLSSVSDAAGVTATVTYNSGTGKYDVALSKGSATDSKTITMTVNESTDPDLATVTAAKTAAENATYTATTQAATGTESAAQAYVQNIATTAVNNSGVTVTVDKVSYTAPVAGTSSVRDGTNGSYIFTITVSKGSQSQTTMQITVVITATAYNGSTGSDGGGGGGSTGGGTTPPTSKPTEPVTGNTENKATVDDNGNANVSISDKNITDAITNAKAEADKKGVNAGEITAVINVTTGGKDATTVSVNLPKVVQEQVIGNKIAKVELVIDRPDLTIGMNLSAVTEINKQANADVQISASKTNAAALSADAQAAIGNRPAYDLKATYQSGGKSVTNFGTGTVSIEIPYKLQSGENAGNIYAVYVDGNGKVTYLTSSSYDAKRETLVFTTNHFSVYGVGFKATSSKFIDTADHWAKDSIDFVVSRGLMNGTSATTFSPNDAMTRGMFVTTLGRLSGVDVSGYNASSFSDVKADAYYMGYIEWANKNNIVVGIGGGKFAPDTLVTREQMAVIMDRYATAIGFKLPEVHAANTFTDNAKIGGWSAESVKCIQMAGIITGKTGNVFDPQGTATRAEVSAVIKRFVELAAFSNTAQGWTMNDSGKWMYYENGKPVTGTKNIDGTTYTFNSYGEIADTPKKLTYGTYTVKKGDSWWKIASEQKCNIYELARINGKTIFSFIYAGEVLKIPQQ